jgi:hypothetical protein
VARDPGGRPRTLERAILRHATIAGLSPTLSRQARCRLQCRSRGAAASSRLRACESRHGPCCDVVHGGKRVQRFGAEHVEVIPEGRGPARAGMEADLWIEPRAWLARRSSRRGGLRGECRGHKFAGLPDREWPDGFGRWTGVRPASYDVSAYLAEWRTFHASIRARVPSAPFAGPDVSGATDWVASFAEAMSEGLVLLTHHYYADGPAGAPHVSLPKLLQSSRQLPPLLERLAEYSRRYCLPYRIVETNSIYDEGQPGVSDTLGAALWGLELMFQATAAGAAGVNFHGGVHNAPRATTKPIHQLRAAATAIVRPRSTTACSCLRRLRAARWFRHTLRPIRAASRRSLFGRQRDVARLPDQPEHHAR